MTRKAANSELAKLGWASIHDSGCLGKWCGTAKCLPGSEWPVFDLLSHRGPQESGLRPAIERLVEAVRKLEQRCC